MWDQLFALLRSGKASDRIRGWKELQSCVTGSQKALASWQRELLARLLLEEAVNPDDQVWKTGVSAMLALPQSERIVVQRDQAEAMTAPPPSEEESLCSWFWRSFKRKSAVFGLSDPNQRRRDGESLMHLARYFCPHNFANTKIHLMRFNDTLWDTVMIDERYQSICIVGRYGIFGHHVVEQWDNPNTRFSFLLQERPPNLPLDQIHPRYHCITETLADGSIEYHRSMKNGKQRIDYGIVRRYLARDGQRRVVVVNCAGVTSVSTLAATTWVIRDLGEPLGPASAPIPVPPSLTQECEFEALVKVKADVEGYAWRPKEIELVKLYAGRYVWSADSCSWTLSAPSRITLVSDGEDATLVEIDGKPVSFRPESQTFRLFLKVCESVLESGDGTLDVAAFSRDTEIWNGSTQTEKETRRRLTNLKYRYLRGCLRIDKKGVRLNATVEKVKSGSRR